MYPSPGRGPAVGLGLLLSAIAGCSGGGDALAPVLAPPTAAPTPVVEAGEVVALVRGYLDVIERDPRFDECGPEVPGVAAHRCLRGPRSGTALDAAVHEWLQGQWLAIPELREIQTQTFDFPRYAPEA
jgi:hypothetical protein